MPSISIKEYYAEHHSTFTNADARKIGPVLHELSKQGGVTSRDVLDTARSANSPLHPYFEWDNAVAADLWRLRQAGNMLASIRVRFIEDGSGDVKEARAFQVTRRGAYEAEPRRYHTFQVLHGDSAFAAQMMDSAIDDLLGWRRKYEPYTEMWERFGDAFQQVVNQISEFEDEAATGNVALATDNALSKLLAWRDDCAEVVKTWTAAREQVSYIFDAIKNAEAVFSKVSERRERNCLK